MRPMHNQARLMSDALADRLCTKPITDYEAFLALLDRVSGGDHGLLFLLLEGPATALCKLSF